MAAMAVPGLQVGAPCPDSSVCGDYADYVASSTDPTEKDTAITNGNTILFAGNWGSANNTNTVKLGGQYDGSLGTGDNYSNFVGLDPANNPFTDFDGIDGAIAVLAVPDGFLAEAMSLTLGGNGVFYSSTTLSGLFPNNHDPLKDDVSDFVFINIGNFADTQLGMPNFPEDSVNANEKGEVKELTLGGVDAALAWIHFDVIALQTDLNNQSVLVTTWENNPGSKDVTWKGGNGGSGGNGGQGGGDEIPEPGVLALLGMGLLGMVLTRRRYSH